MGILARKLLVADDAAAAKVLTYQNTIASFTGSNPYTATITYGGAETSDRVVHVSFMARASTTGRTLSSATIGGISATINVQITDATTNYICGIISAVVPTGTSGDVVLTFSHTSIDRIRGGFYTSTGLSSATAHASTSDDTDGNVSLTLNTTTDGFLIVIATNNNNSTGQYSSWSNATEDFEVGGSGMCAGASNTATSGSSTNVTATAGGSPRAAAAASF
jgi:hypothetical protein